MLRRRILTGIKSAFAAHVERSATAAAKAVETSNLPSLNLPTPSATPFLRHHLQQARRNNSWGRPPADTPQKIVVIKPNSVVNRSSTGGSGSGRRSTGRDGYSRFSSPGGGGGGHQHQHHYSPMHRQARVIAVLGAGGALVWASSREEIPYTGRMHAILINTALERQLGESTYKQILLEAKMKGTLLPPTHPATLAVRSVGTRIARVASDGQGGGYQEHMKGLNWQFSVINSNEVNAFVVPGGKVVCYTGLLRLLQSKDELAAVLAHEAGHIVGRHGAERMTQGSVLELLRFVAYVAFGLPIPAGALSAMFFLPNSRKAETEADVIGLQLAARACFDPAAAVSVFEKLGAEEARQGGAAAAVPAMLRTHPVTSDRIKRIKEMLPRAEELRLAAGCDSSLFSAFGRFISQQQQQY